MITTVRHRTRALDLGAPRGQRLEGTRKRFRMYSPEVDPHIAAFKAASQSQQIKDPFTSELGAIQDASGLSILEPPYNFASLLRLPRDNNMLRQCIDAMVTNVEGHGWRLEYTGPDGQEDSAAAKNELQTLENLLDFPNDDHGLQELRERVRRDLEVIGNAYIEVGRDRQGRVVMAAHVPAHTIRLTTKERDGVEVTVTLPREGEARKQKITKRFGRFVQIVGARRTFFKEYGDPRTINPENGRQDDAIGLEQSATELIHLRMYIPGTPYGIPRWINQLPAILGSRQAELTNLDFFKENAIPAMALLVSGGSVTQTTLDEIEDQFLASRGRQSFNRILIIEAHGDEDAASQDGTIPVPKLELRPLQNERQKDALFQNYDKNNMAKIRSSFRMPPIFVGMSEDYTHATAKTSFAVAESQVFGPERARSDDMWNLKMLGTYTPKFWSFRSLPPRISDPADIINAIETFDGVGALTPNVAIGLANDFFDLEITSVEEEWGDFPFATVTALVNQGFMPAGFEELMSSLPQETESEEEPGPDDQGARAEVMRVIGELRSVLNSAHGNKKPRRRSRTPAPRHRARR